MLYSLSLRQTMSFKDTSCLSFQAEIVGKSEKDTFYHSGDYSAHLALHKF